MKKIHSALRGTFAIFFLTLFFAAPDAAFASKAGEKLYEKLSGIARSGEASELFLHLNEKARSVDYTVHDNVEFDGNLRILRIHGTKEENDGTRLYLLRKLDGEVYILSILADNPYYTDLEKMSENKLIFKVGIVKSEVDGEEYTFAELTALPVQPAFDRIFKISIVLMLFLIMVGMGMTLTVKEFAVVFRKPFAIFIGEVLQFGLLPLAAIAVGYFSGFYHDYPYIYMGFILIAVSPGGVTSNLMTHYAKGDLALSISLTSFSTVLSLFFTPFLLALYCKNVPEVSIPIKTVVLSIFILVIIPLFIGMLVKSRWDAFAKKATPFFSLLGIIAVLFIMVAGVASNLDKLADVERYGFKFYSMVFILTFGGMILGGIVPKIFKINNYQTRAISIETGLRNSALSMTLAILMQDKMGDFYSSMFFVSGIFGLMMYVAGLIALFSFNRLLPLAPRE